MKFLITAFVLCLPILTFAQDFKTSNPDKAIIYIYGKDAPMTIGRVRASVFSNGKEIAKTAPEQYFIVTADAGKRTFYFEKSRKSGGIELDLESGKVYYLRVGWKTSFLIRADTIDLVPQENGAFELKSSKPISSKDIKDKNLVSNIPPK